MMRLFWGIVLGVAMLAVAMPSDAQALTLYTDRAAWEAAVGNHADVDLGSQYEEGDWASDADLPRGDYLAFDDGYDVTGDPSDVQLETTSDHSYSWFEGEYPDGDGGSYWDWSSNNAFGLEIRPFLSQDSVDYYSEYLGDDEQLLEDSLFEAFDVDLVLYDDTYYGIGESEGQEGGDFWPEPTVLRQRVGVNGGAAFFGWVGGNVWDFDININGNPVYSFEENPDWYWDSGDGQYYYYGDYAYADGFTIGRMVEGIPTTTTPEPASMVLMGLGAVVTALRRRKR